MARIDFPATILESVVCVNFYHVWFLSTTQYLRGEIKNICYVLGFEPSPLNWKVSAETIVPWPLC